MNRRAWLASPALHMIVLGASMFALVQTWCEAAPQPRPRVEIPAYRLEQVRADIIERRGRPPSADEWQVIREELIEEELLVQYAISLGMHADPAVQSRLAQIAQFVDEQPDTPADEQTLARRAIELGLHERDLVVRRILADRARRLIRAVVLVRRPAPELIEAFYTAHAEDFVRPAEVGFSLITVNTFKWSDSESRATELRARIDADGLDFDSAMSLSDESALARELGPMNERELERDLGPGFAAAVFDAELEHWTAPIRSRHGHHLVFVHTRIDARLPELEEVRERVERELLQQLADEWLAQRLQQLRADSEVVVAGEVQ